MLQLWSGSYDLGLAAARGNARTFTLTNNFAASRVTTHDKVALHFDEIYATALVNRVNSTTASAVRGGWSYNRDLNPKVFLSTLNEYEHDGISELGPARGVWRGRRLESHQDARSRVERSGGRRLRTGKLHAPI